MANRAMKTHRFPNSSARGAFSWGILTQLSRRDKGMNEHPLADARDPRAGLRRVELRLVVAPESNVDHSSARP